MLGKPALPSINLDKTPMLLKIFRETSAVVQVEILKLKRDPFELFSRAVQPLLWLLVFGKVMAQVKGVAENEIDYLSFLAPGILAQSLLFSSIFYGISIIWEKDLGVVHKLLVSPAFTFSLVLGKAMAASFRGISQAVIVYLASFLIGVKVSWSFSSILGVVGLVILSSGLFSTFSLIIACLVKTRERFMGIGQLLSMPLFFASNAVYPLSLMPPVIKFLAQLNPLTYLVDALRYFMIDSGAPEHSMIWNFGILVVFFGLFLYIATRLYPGIIR